MSWVYQIDRRALRELRRLGREDQRHVLRYLDERVSGDADPRRFGSALKLESGGLWRYRVGDIRVICRIEDEKLTVLVLRVEHRRDVYE